jgi:hypothetical protein
VLLLLPLLLLCDGFLAAAGRWVLDTAGLMRGRLLLIGDGAAV